MKKIITVIMLVIAITLCGACTLPQEFDDLKTQTAALERLISSQQELIEGLQNKLNGNDQNAALTQEKIEELQKLNDELQNKLIENEQNSTVMNEEIAELKKQNDLYKAQLRNLIGEPVKFTAKKPIYQRYNYNDNDKEIVRFNNKPGYSTPFLDFLKYNEENNLFGDKKIIIFKPDDYEDEGWGIQAGGKDRYYTIFERDGVPMIYMGMDLYSEVFGDRDVGIYSEGGISIQTSLSMSMYFMPFDPQRFEDSDINYLRLEFGKYDIVYDSISYERKYINLYIGDFCIGTCYYNAYKNISYTGFRDYLYNHLEILQRKI